MSITRDFKLSLVAGRSVPLVINANQYDDGEIWRFTLLDENGQKYSPSTGSIIGLKSDGHIIANAGTVSSTGLVIIAETEQMTASPGKNFYELLIDDDTHGTANFVVFVEPRPGAGGTPSDSDLAVFQEAIDAAAQIGDASELVDDVAVLKSRMDEFTTLTDGSTTGDAELADIRVGADGTTYPNAGDAVRGQVSDLKNALVSKKGENQVTPQNLEGMQFTKTADVVEGDNIFSESYLRENGFYISVNTTVTPPIIAHAILSDYSWYAIPVDGESKYRFTEARFACLAKGNTVGSEAVGTNNAYATELTTTGASYLLLSYPTSTTDIEVHKVTTETIYSDFILPDWLVDNLPIPTVVEKPKFASITGNLASNGNIQLTAPRNNLRKGERIVFEGNISSFDSLRIGLTYGTSLDSTQQINTFVIDDTNVSYYAWSTSTPVTVAHRLTLANNIQIIWEMSAEASVKLTLISNGNMFSHEFAFFTRQTIGNPFVLSSGTVLTECRLSWTCNDIDKDIWMFGDSYFAYSPNRWTYYLHQYGYDQNCLLDGFPGEGGTNGRVAFNNLLQYGTPKFAVWCLGMNDRADSDSAPSADWVSARDYFLQYCTDNNITPIFGTIPTVPTINHEQKNAWIRSSGYRYIDFAKAVGASASGVWFSGMLSSDNVHPSETGAKALFAQVLIDLPEIMVGGYGTPTSA